MRKQNTFTFLAVMLVAVLLSASSAAPQTQTAAQKIAADRAAGLRQQLADVEAQQTTMQARLQQLEEDLKPENIEKSLAGVGSTKPEELRERRRRELEIQKNNVDFQLTRLAKSKARLETGIAQADADVYHASAGVNADGTPAAPAREATGNTSSAKPQTESTSSVKRHSRRVRRNRTRTRTSRS